MLAYQKWHFNPPKAALYLTQSAVLSAYFPQNMTEYDRK